MSSNKLLRTPIIKPRTSGGTFYTFGSAMEDIGLNISEQNNRVSISHYVLLDLPDPVTSNTSSYPSGSSTADYTFAENFQNYVLNMETVLRNQENYNFAANNTVSERVFWKWLADSTSFVADSDDPKYMVEENTTDKPSIAKAFGLISASSRRSDDCGLYNETFVQVPSSYGRMKVLFKPFKDENYANGTYHATNADGLIENISSDEIDGTTIKSTGISALAQYDGEGVEGEGTYTASSAKDYLRVEFDINALREYYGDDTLTIDDIGMNKVPSEKMLADSDAFTFNAILVYYSIYDAAANKTLAVNPYGVLILDSAGTSDGFPSIEKRRSTPTASGTSYAFRINIKTTSTYTSSITVNDNSTASYSMSEDFNEVVKNLSKAVDTLKSNSATLANIASENIAIKRLAATAIDKCNDLEATINAMRTDRVYDSMTAEDVYSVSEHSLAASEDHDASIQSNTIDEILETLTAKMDESGDVAIQVVEPETMSENAKKIFSKLVTSTSDGTYINTSMLIAILLAKMA